MSLLGEDFKISESKTSMRYRILFYVTFFGIYIRGIKLTQSFIIRINLFLLILWYRERNTFMKKTKRYQNTLENPLLLNRKTSLSF